MGKMKMIYEMVQDGSANLFLDTYRNARINNAVGFTFDYKYYDVVKARSIVSIIKKAQKEYDDHLVDQIENYYEWQSEMERGR